MPPKGKKGKKGKKEAEKERELEEQRRLAEEEQKASELRAKREKEQREQKQREALEQLFHQEEPKLQEESEHIQRVRETKNSEYTLQMDQINTQKEWNSYLECSVLPDPLHEQDMNSYMSILREQKLVKEDDASLKPLFSLLPDVELLCSKIEYFICTMHTSKPENTVEQMKNHLARLRELINTKWDFMTAQILQHIDYFKREPNENFEFSSSTENYSIGIWGNMTKNPRFKSVEFRDKSLSSTLPKPLALANVAIRMLLEQSTTCASPYETQSEKQQLSVVGGVLYFDLAEMPDSAKSLGSWCIRPILSSEGSLYRCVYPFKKPIVEGEKEEDASAADLTIWPMHVTYELYPGMFLNTATAKVMAWNPDTELWDDDNITDVEIDIDLGQVKFRTLHFRPTALIQGLYSEFPLQDWLMKPSPTKNRSTLWIRGKENEAEIEIGEGECRFVAPMKPFMEKEFLDKWYPPELLFKKLLHYGLNFRAPKKMKGVDIEDLILKNPDPEEDCLLGISLCQPCFVFRRSSGNRHLPPSKIAFRAHVCSDPKSFDSEDPEVSWWSVVHDSTFTIDEAAKTIAYVTKETEITEDVKFNAEARENMTLHSSVYHTLACMPPEDEASKIEQVSAVWTRTVAEIMKITRLLSFS